MELRDISFEDFISIRLLILYLLEIFIFIFEYTFSRAELEIYRCPLESEKLSDLILYIATIRKVKVISVIHRNDESRRIDIDL